jgi:glycosyltransferase involved in cell wall biosynthesis
MRTSEIEPCPRDQAAPPAAPVRVLVVLNSICFYGMERNVIDTFDALRPAVEPVIFIPRAAARYKTNLFSELTRRGLTVEFFSDTRDWPRIGKPKSIRQAYEIATALLRGNRDLWKAAYRADVIYIPILTGLYFSLFASAMLRFKKRKVIYTFHDLLWKPSLRLRLGALFVSDFVHMTEYSRETATAANPSIARKQNHVIPPVTDLSKRAAAGDQFSVPTHGRFLLFVGQIAKHKGIDLLLEAFRRIAPQFPDVTLHVAGGAAYEYGSDFQQVLDSTGLGHRVRHWGYVDNVEPLLRSCYVYVHPSLPSVFHESFGSSAVEAMSTGAPTVCFRSGALTEIVRHDETGLICEEESAECLAAALAGLLADPAKRNQYSRNCLRRYQENYSEERVHRQWAALTAPVDLQSTTGKG